MHLPLMSPQSVPLALCLKNVCDLLCQFEGRPLPSAPLNEAPFGAVSASLLSVSQQHPLNGILHHTYMLFYPIHENISIVLASHFKPTSIFNMQNPNSENKCRTVVDAKSKHW